MKTEIDYIEYDSEMPTTLGHSLPHDFMDMYQRPPQPQAEVPPFYLQSYHQAQWIRQHQKQPQQAPPNFQPDPPPLHFSANPAPNITITQSRPYMHPQYRSQQLHLQQQEQQRRHQQMLQQNMMRMQNHMMIRQQQVRMPSVAVRQQAPHISIQQPSGTQWRFHNVRSLAPVVNANMTATPPPLMPVECQLAETPAPTANYNERAMDDFNDFDVTDLLRLTFGDENEQNDRKRRASSKSSSESVPSKRVRRTKAELIAERNSKLFEQCKEVSINLESIDFPDHVRLFGRNIMRENLPNVPNMKLSPKTIDFTRIRNVGYLVTKKGICFSCLTEQCKFKSYDLERFKGHLNTYHHVEGSGSNQGYCRACQMHCCGYSLADEVEHILTRHVPSAERHPMHQILYSHVKKPALVEYLEEDISIILENIEDVSKRIGDNNSKAAKNDSFMSTESDVAPRRKSKRRGILEYYVDDDYRPDEDEDDDEIESECEKIVDEMSHSEADYSSDDQEPVFDDTDSESGQSNSYEWEIVEAREDISNPTTEKSSQLDESSKESEIIEKPQNAHAEFDDVPEYILNRIYLYSTTKHLQDDEAETRKMKLKAKKFIEEIIQDENSEESPKLRRKRRRKPGFARKRTSTPVVPKLNKLYDINSVADLPTCRVLLKRIQDDHDDKSETENMITEIDVPIDLPTPPASEHSRDSLPSPPLNKTVSSESPKEQAEKDSDLCDNSKVVANEEIIEIKGDSEELIEVNLINDSNNNESDDIKIIEREDVPKSIEKKAEEQVVEKMRTRNSRRLDIVSDDVISIDDKENTGTTAVVNNNSKVAESPKTPRKISGSKLAVSQRFLKKFHKIDNFFQKAGDKESQIEHQEKLEEDLKNDSEPPIVPQEEQQKEPPDISNEIIEINESPDLLDELDNDVIPITRNTSLVIDDVESGVSFDDDRADNELISMSEIYPWINRETTELVLKTRKCLNILKQELTQFSTFKCMEQTCSYFTTNFDKFKTHIDSHSGAQYCSFCLHKSTNSKDLIIHLESSHKYDRYQCSLCMYRAAERVYVEWHQKRYHICPSEIVLKSPTQILMKSTRNKVREELENEGRKKFVLSYKCKTHGCSKEFFNKKNYQDHLKEESESPQLAAYIDDICTQILQMDQTRMKTYKEGYNQCLYCEYGSDLDNDIHNHMADDHSNKLAFVCRRADEIPTINLDDPKNSNSEEEEETLEKQTRIEYIGASSYKLKQYKGDVKNLTANEEARNDQNETENSNENSINLEINEDKDAEMEVNESLNDSTASKSSTLPVIREIIHIDNF